MYSNGVSLFPLVVAEPSNSYESSKAVEQWIEVLVDCPGSLGLFTYRLPPQLLCKPGDILSVPFGAQQLGAIAIRLLTQPSADIPREKIRDVEDVIHSGFFQDNYWTLIERVSQYYYTQLIQVIRVALPPGLLGRSQRRIRLVLKDTSPDFLTTEAFLSNAARQIVELLRSSAAGDYSFTYLQQKVKGAYRGVRELSRCGMVESYLEPPRLTRPKLQKAVTMVGSSFDRDLTTRQKEILEVLRRHGGELWQTELLQICSASSSTLKTLEIKGYIVIQEREILRSETPASGILADQGKSLTQAQSQALATINQLNGYAQVLLHGVTGSGKTEVYLQAIAPLLNQNKSALVLVPEIGLTPQLTDRFRARFGNKVSVYHSALSDGERYDTWRQMLTGEPQVVIGTRSAVFAPLPNLGLIILDEEHDSSFKQDSPIPTYHARTVAQWRAELENCPLILGSATPSLESWLSVRGEEQERQGGQTPPAPCPLPPASPLSHYLPLPERIYSRPLPPVEVVDMRQEL
ncbi:MAG: primosomal protein N', partial [Tolypothrix sp. T3-bin4]|nr:primosomal protein N' [Tolypothrix sp. T3-bin4]